MILFLRHLSSDSHPQTRSPYEIWNDFGDFKMRDINFRLLKAIFNPVKILYRQWTKVKDEKWKPGFETALRHLTWWKSVFIFFFFLTGREFFLSICCFRLWKCELVFARMWVTKMEKERKQRFKWGDQSEIIHEY